MDTRECKLSISVINYDNIINGQLKNYLSLSEKIGGVVQEQSTLVEAAFVAQRNFLLCAAMCKQPSKPDVESLLKPTSEQLLATQTLREKNRSSELFNHLSAVSEAISALGWVTVYPDPWKYAKELQAAGAYYGNKVITGYKEKNPVHSAWAKAWLQVLGELHSYIRENHRTGLQWNSQGHDNLNAGNQVSTQPSTCGMPIPPPPPPPPQFYDSPNSDPSDVRAALFKEINQGEDVTKGLKKVSVETHRKVSQAVIGAPKPFKQPTYLSHQAKPAKPPKLELEGRKWCVEYYQNDDAITLPETSMNQSVCIYQCHNCVINLPMKVNCITVDSCKKTCLVFSGIVSFVEFINCQDMKAQAKESVPTITIDKTDGIQLFLNEQGFGVEIVSSKSSEINVCTIQPDGDFVEYPVPEQFKTTISRAGLKTVIVEKV